MLERKAVLPTTHLVLPAKPGWPAQCGLPQRCACALHPWEASGRLPRRTECASNQWTPRLSEHSSTVQRQLLVLVCIIFRGRQPSWCHEEVLCSRSAEVTYALDGCPFRAATTLIYWHAPLGRWCDNPQAPRPDMPEHVVELGTVAVPDPHAFFAISPFTFLFEEGESLHAGQFCQ